MEPHGAGVGFRVEFWACKIKSRLKMLEPHGVGVKVRVVLGVLIE